MTLNESIKFSQSDFIRIYTKKSQTYRLFLGKFSLLQIASLLARYHNLYFQQQWMPLKPFTCKIIIYYASIFSFHFQSVVFRERIIGVICIQLEFHIFLGRICWKIYVEENEPISLWRKYFGDKCSFVLI